MPKAKSLKPSFIRFDVITLFPEVIERYAAHSIIGRAMRNKIIAIKAHQLRDFSKRKHKQVDDRPYGGGPGMVLDAATLLNAVDRVKRLTSRASRLKPAIIITSAGGRQFTNTDAKAFAKKYTRLIIIAGHYEGIDARVAKALKAKEYSVGPYILTGGEVPAMVIIDAIARQKKGVLGKFESLEEGRAASSEVYTRPEILTYKGKKYRVPKILLSGNHAKIAEWKKSKQKLSR